MLDNGYARELRGQHHVRDLMREAERARLVRLATQGQKRARIGVVDGFWMRVRRFLAPAAIQAHRPSATVAG